MRFAHLSDSHLGNRQFGIFEREQDFYKVFERTIDKIIELDVDFVIHSGDLFDQSRPSTDALLTFQNGLLRLNEHNIPIYAIAGNHDSILRKDVKPPLVLFRQLGLKLISPNKPAYEFEDILICGTPYMPLSQKENLIDTLNELSKLTKDYSKSILVFHQGIEGHLPEGAYELNLNDIPDNFDYYAMGHLHDYIRKEHGRGLLVYPGSMELLNVSSNFEEFGKGFCLVEITDDGIEIERITIDVERQIIKECFKYDRFEEELLKIKNHITSLVNPPIVELKIMGGESDSADVTERVQKQLKEHVLSLRVDYIPKRDMEIMIDPSKDLDPKTMLSQIVKEKYGEIVSGFSVDLYEKLSAGEYEDAKVLSNDYFKNNYSTLKEDKKPKVTLDAYGGD